MAVKRYEFFDKALDYKAWITIDSLKNKMSFGGCRLALSVTQSEVDLLADCMTKKLLYHGLPVGGAKAGIQVDTSRQDLKQVLANFAIQAKQALTDEVMIGKDLGATNEIIDGIYQAIAIPQTQVGKTHTKIANYPERLRDFSGYINHMTAQGMIWALSSYLGRSNLEGLRISIQGAGAVGLGSVFRTQEFNTTIVSISDRLSCLVLNQKCGFDQINSFVDAGLISDFSKGEKLEREAVFSQDSDVLILAANSHSVDAKMAEKISAKYVLEGSNFGLTDEARVVLKRRGVVVIPDILANSSSAALVALQMASGNKLSSEQVWETIERNIRNCCTETKSIADETGLSMREAFCESVFPKLKSQVEGATFK